MSRGFTLLEVLVSLMILAMAMVATGGIASGAFDSSNYARHLQVATMLARSKLIDIEEQLRKDGFGDDEKEFSGKFEEEGFDKFRFEAIVRPIEVDVSALVSNLFGADMESEEFPAQIQGYLDAFRGEGNKDTVDQVANSQLSAMMSSGGLEIIFKQVGETLKNSIREVELTIHWKDGKYKESVTFVEYVVTNGRLTLPSSTGIKLPANPSGPPLPGHRNPSTLLPPQPGFPTPGFQPGAGKGAIP